MPAAAGRQTPAHTRDDPLELGLGGAEGPLNAGDRHVQRRHAGHDHHEAHAHDAEDQPPARMPDFGVERRVAAGIRCRVAAGFHRVACHAGEPSRRREAFLSLTVSRSRADSDGDAPGRCAANVGSSVFRGTRPVRLAGHLGKWIAFPSPQEAPPHHSRLSP